MADQNVEVVGEAVQQFRDDLEKADQEMAVFGEREEEPSRTGSLRSDFCKVEDEHAEEEEGEGYWVCREQEEAGEYNGYGVRYTRGEDEGEGETEMDELTTEERRSLDSQYLKTVLGTPLTFALMDIATKRPTDPIQYLGCYLLKWRWANTSTTDYNKKIERLNEERQAYIEGQRERERQIMLENEEREEEFRRAEREESTIEDEDEDLGEDLGLEGE